MVARIMDAVRPFGARTPGNAMKATTPRRKPGDVTSHFVGAAFNVSIYSTGQRNSLSIVKAPTVISTRRLREIELVVHIIINIGANFAVR